MRNTDPFLTEVEQYIRATASTPTKFGKDAAGDPTFVFDLREGREPRRRTRERVLQFIKNNPPPRSRRRMAEAAA